MSKHYEKFNRLQEKLIEMSDVSGNVTATYQELATIAGIQNLSSTKNYLSKMLSDGFLTLVVEPRRGIKGTTYHVNKSMAIRATEADEEKFIIINFGGVELKIVKDTPIGMAMDVEDLAVSCLTEKSTIEKIFDANREIFEPCIINMDSKIFINRTGILAFLLKLNTSRILEVKRQTLVDFNNTVLSIMTESMLKGKVILKDHQHIEIRTNLSNLTGLEMEQVEQMFHKIEDEVNEIIGGLTGEIKSVEKKLNRTSGLLENEKKRYTACLSEKLAIQNQLLERN